MRELEDEGASQNSPRTFNEMRYLVARALDPQVYECCPRDH